MSCSFGLGQKPLEKHRFFHHFICTRARSDIPILVRCRCIVRDAHTVKIAEALIGNHRMRILRDLALLTSLAIAGRTSLYWQAQSLAKAHAIRDAHLHLKPLYEMKYVSFRSPCVLAAPKEAEEVSVPSNRRKLLVRPVMRPMTTLHH